MPVYNKEKYLRKSIESVLQQTFQDYELICIDDGSTDQSLRIIKEYSINDERVKIISISNGGVSNARNTGLEYATGEWIQFLDADDLICTDYLADVLSINNLEDTDVVFSDINVVNDHYEKIGVKTININSLRITQDELKELFLKYQYQNGYFGFLANKLIRSEIIKKNHICFDVRINLAEDLLFMVHVYENMNIGYKWDGAGYQYLYTDDNYQFRKKIDYALQIEIQKSIYNWIDNNYGNEKNVEPIKQSISGYAYAILFEGNDEGLPIADLTRKLLDELEIEKYLLYESFDGFPRKIIRELTIGNTSKIERLFKYRTIVRSVYRRIKKWGKRY